jgi:hypothetical protein
MPQRRRYGTMQPVRPAYTCGATSTLLRWVSLAMVGLSVACAGVLPPQAATSGAVPPAPPAPESESLPSGESNAEVKMAKLEVAEAAGVAPEDAPSPSPSPQGAAPAPMGLAVGGTPSAQPDAPEVAPAMPNQPMMDIEAKLVIEVKNVSASLKEVHTLVAAARGQILAESITDANPEGPRASLTVRVPAGGAFDVLGQLEGIGDTRSRQMNSRDVGKEFFDATLRVQSLEQILQRYHELLTKANTIDETMRVEEQIARVSGEIERIKGELRWLKDRVARATIQLEVYVKGEWVQPVVTPEAKFYPGVRALAAADWRGNAGSHYGFGAGLSLRFSRYFSIDLDGLQSTSAPDGGFEMALVTLGGEIYSDYLGAGQREWFNPYLGLRAGYGRIEGNNQVLAGGSLGLDIFKVEEVSLSFDLRFLGAFGDDLGSHLIVQPALGLNVAF